MYNAPCVVTDYPKDIKAFYMKLNPDGKTVAAMDILVPKIGEDEGAGLRGADHEAPLPSYGRHHFVVKYW